MGNKLWIFLTFIGLFIFSYGNAQSSLCENIEPFCAGSERLTFPNSNYTNSNIETGEDGPDYGCLVEQYYPAWFYLQIEEPGDLQFTISQYTNSDLTGAPLDVDFVVWGPFELGDDFCNALTENKIVDCSYLPDAVETMTINAAEANDIYIVVITNFEKLPGYISLQQIDNGPGQGSTDCSILDGTLGDFIPVCGEDSYTLNGYTDEAGSYAWYLKNETTGNYDPIPGADEPELTVTQSGDYRLVVADAVGGNQEEDDVTVTFYENPEIGEASDVYICSEDAGTVDLTNNSAALISPNSNPQDYEVDYYENQSDLDNNISIAAPETYDFTEGATIYARVRHVESGCFSEAVSFQLKYFQMSEIDLLDSTYFCVDASGNLITPVTLGEDLGNDYEYEWQIGNFLTQDAVVTITEFPNPANIELTIRHKQTGCEQYISIVPVPIEAPEDVSVEIEGSDFGDGYTVKATVENQENNPDANFQYRIDNGEWQENGVFKNVSPGKHTVTVRERHGCGSVTSEEFFLIGYPRFFTPNSDGYNDTWKIISSNQVQVQSLYIFDRYGKLIKQLNSSNLSWDGTFNGKPMPADDYWFRIKFTDDKTGKVRSYSANFSLIR